MALRGRFLVGSQPVGGDFVRRFVMTAAENGIDVFRLHDPLNDVSNLREAGEAITSADREFDAGLIYSPGPTGETDTLVEQARKSRTTRTSSSRPSRKRAVSPLGSTARARAGAPSRRRWRLRAPAETGSRAPRIPSR
jgi:hypothetical protein